MPPSDLHVPAGPDRPSLAVAAEPKTFYPPSRTFDEAHDLPRLETERVLSRGEQRSPQTLLDLFRRIARDAGMSVAVTAGDSQLCYAELAARADRVAAMIEHRGIGPGAPIAVYMDRSPEMIVSLLGILGSGNAYVPIDPAYPSARVSFMLEDSHVPLALTQPHLYAALPEVAETAIVEADGSIAAWSQRSAVVPESVHRDAADGMAYVIYTSGSTGKPKGVIVQHASVLNYLQWMQDEYPIGPDDRVLQKAPFSFDASIWELFLPLTTGARMVLARREEQQDPEALLRAIERERITVVQLVPAQLQLVVGNASFERAFASVRHLICGGEALPAELLRSVRRRVRPRVTNLYGPTEATVYATHWSLAPEDEWDGDTVPIGRPIRNTRIHVLGADGLPTAGGEAGELVIAGAGVAAGYLARPQLTAERFIPDPDVDGARMYRTGDRARWRSDGNLEYLGRLDNQVKLRGFRIELGEVETALARLPGVLAAAAIISEEVAGDPRLIGYVAVAQPDSASGVAMRRALADTLPSYMVPSTIVALDALPLTGSGKVDRRQLPSPSQRGGADARAREIVAARTPTEARLIEIWEDVLRMHPIGTTDNVLDLGATSITSARAFARMRTEMGATLPASPLFEAPTVAQLAAAIDSGASPQRWTSLVPMQPHGSRPPFYCVHGGVGTILHLRRLAMHLGDDQPFYGLQAQGLYDNTPPHRTVEQMAAHYIDEIRSLQAHGPYYLGGYCMGTVVAFEMAQQLRAAGEQVAIVVLFNGPSPTYTRRFGSWPRTRVQQRTPEAPTASRRERALLAAKHLYWGMEWPHLVGHVHVAVARAVAPIAARACPMLRRPIPGRWRSRTLAKILSLAERRYEPRAYGGHVAVFRAAMLFYDGDLGWRRHVTGPFDVVDLPGEHHNQRTAFNEPLVQGLAERLSTVLQSAAAEVLPR